MEEIVEGVVDDLSCMVLCPVVIQDLDGGQVAANDPLSRMDNPLQ